jgi:hypothetical protein
VVLFGLLNIRSNRGLRFRPIHTSLNLLHCCRSTDIYNRLSDFLGFSSVPVSWVLTSERSECAAFVPFMEEAISLASETGTAAQMEANGIVKKAHDAPRTAESCKATYVEQADKLVGIALPMMPNGHLAYPLIDEQYGVTVARQNVIGHHSFSS